MHNVVVMNVIHEIEQGALLRALPHQGGGLCERFDPRPEAFLPGEPS
jgi:hypothetical protein